MVGCKIVGDREAEQIDHFVGVRSDDVSAQNAIGVLLDQCLEAVDQFMEAYGRVPVRNLLRVLSEFDTLRARLRLAEANPSNWGNCECDARNAPVVRPAPAPLPNIPRPAAT